MIRWIFGLLCLLALLHTGSVWAQASTPPAQPPQATPVQGGGYFEGIETVVGRLKGKLNRGLFNAMLEAGLDIANESTPFCYRIGGGLISVYLFMWGVEALGSRKLFVVDAIFDLAVPIAISGLFLVKYESLVRGLVGDGGLLEPLANLGGDATVQLGNFIFAVLGMVAKTIKDTWGALGTAWSGGISAFVFGLADGVMVLFVALVVLLLVLSSFAELIALILIGPFLIGVAAAIGKFMIVGLVTPWTRGYFVQWLSFLVGAQILKGIVSISIKVGIVIFAAFDFTTITSSGVPHSVGLLIAVLTLVAFNNMIRQAPTIAAAFSLGRMGVARSGGSDLGSLSSAVSNGVGDGVRGGIGAVKGAMEAKEKLAAWWAARKGGGVAP